MSDCSPLPPDITSLETSNDPSHTQSYTELALPTASTFVSTEDSHDARLVAMSALSLLEEDARPSCRDGYQRKHGNQGILEWVLMSVNDWCSDLLHDASFQTTN